PGEKEGSAGGRRAATSRARDATKPRPRAAATTRRPPEAVKRWLERPVRAGRSGGRCTALADRDRDGRTEPRDGAVRDVADAAPEGVRARSGVRNELVLDPQALAVPPVHPRSARALELNVLH